MKKTQICVNTPQKKVLTYIVEDYELKEGFVFLETEEGIKKGFPAGWCEITEVN